MPCIDFWNIFYIHYPQLAAPWLDGSLNGGHNNDHCKKYLSLKQLNFGKLIMFHNVPITIEVTSALSEYCVSAEFHLLLEDTNFKVYLAKSQRPPLQPE